jgi:hypothetical protein
MKLVPVMTDPSLPPANGVVSRAAEKDALVAYNAELVSATVEVHLFNNNIIYSDNIDPSTLTETTFIGYAPVAVSTWSGPFSDETGDPYYVTANLVFSCTGTGDIVWGWYMMKIAGTQATGWTATLTAGAVSAVAGGTGGAGYTQVPRVSWSGGGGTSLVLQAVLTAGVVTAINVISSSSDFATPPTIVVDKAGVLAGGGNFSSSIPVENGDAIPFTVKLAA